ncbi:MAG: DUF2461 domain-containing protein [Bacteroidota bacterium]|nr:DUF2461 domain-containing protein [Bacteroidota bacterium]MDP3144453.1 DUF2461 domain-containing protein [Bacteroidota bacterium]
MDSIFSFLKKLETNNNRDWFEKNKPNYLKAKEEFEAFVQEIIEGISKFDKRISPDMKAKDCTFRIYKDVRFSKDKTPYKNNMGASINPGGKKSIVPGYYFHLQPGGNFIAGGVWMPEPEILNAIRQEIDYNSAPLLKILNSASFKKYYKGVDDEGALKTAPKGYDKEHPLIDLLRNRHFIVSHAFTNKQISDKNAVKEIVAGFKAMYPFLHYLREATDK